MAELEDKAALITGASAGIGRETARSMAREGADVAVAARRTDRLNKLTEELRIDYGVETCVIPTNVSKPEQVEAMVEKAVSTFGGLDIVVSNAGIGPIDQPVDEAPLEQYFQLMDVNVNGMFFTASYALPHLRQSQGNLIFVGSLGGQYPRPNIPIYAASKWWTRGFAHSLAGTYGSEGVGVSVINPTETRTEISIGDSPPLKDRYESGAASEPETIAEAISFIAKHTAPDYIAQLDLYRRDKLAEFKRS